MPVSIAMSFPCTKGVEAHKPKLERKILPVKMNMKNPYALKYMS